MTLVTANDDHDSTNTFEAYFIPSETWNGALKPFFSGIESSRIAEDTAINYPYGQQFRWNSQLDGGNGGYEYDLNDESAPPVWSPVPTMDVDGVTYYQMGDGFTWHEVGDYDADNDNSEYAELVAAVAAATAEHADIMTTDLHYSRI